MGEGKKKLQPYLKNRNQQRINKRDTRKSQLISLPKYPSTGTNDVNDVASSEAAQLTSKTITDES